MRKRKPRKPKTNIYFIVLLVLLIVLVASAIFTSYDFQSPSGEFAAPSTTRITNCDSLEEAWPSDTCGACSEGACSGIKYGPNGECKIEYHTGHSTKQEKGTCEQESTCLQYDQKKYWSGDCGSLCKCKSNNWEECGQTGKVWTENSCGPCTGGSCEDKKLGDSCTFTEISNGKEVRRKGKCYKEKTCGDDDSSKWQGDCGLKCFCSTVDATKSNGN